MGQKTHPNGMRVGFYRKWKCSWYGVGSEGKNLFFQQRLVEQIFKIWMSLYLYTKITLIKRILLVDLKLYKEGAQKFYIFVFFYKLWIKSRKKKNWFKGGLKRKNYKRIQQKNNTFKQKKSNVFLEKNKNNIKKINVNKNK